MAIYALFIDRVQTIRSTPSCVQAFDDAIAELDTLSEESYKDSTLIMQVPLVET